VTNFQDRDLVRFFFAARIVKSHNRTDQAIKMSTLESATEFGFDNVRHHHLKDQILAKAKQHITDHIAKARPKIETRRVDPIVRS